MIELKEDRVDPSELSQYRARNPGSIWDNPAFSTIKTSIRHQLNQEQEGLCVYCEGTLDKDMSHIDHIKPRACEPGLTFIYDNMALSCSKKDHCGHFKRNKMLPIEPRIDCNKFFILSLFTFKLIPACGIDEVTKKRINDTIEILGLNHSDLVDQRRQYYMSARSIEKDSGISEARKFITDNPYRFILGGLF
ncbi:MAG: retron system putative HNH endonuclease [Candidatus Xenobiia bacterium LiM19]